MTPADIRAFHTANYHLANMGMIGAYPTSMPLADVLDHLEWPVVDVIANYSAFQDLRKRFGRVF